MTGRRPGRQSLCRAQHPTVGMGRSGVPGDPWAGALLQREALAISGYNRKSWSLPCQGPRSIATVRGTSDKLQTIHMALALLLTLGP
jgi:hypothetical protein